MAMIFNLLNLKDIQIGTNLAAYFSDESPSGIKIEKGGTYEKI
jgi:hypothetical protein